MMASYIPDTAFAGLCLLIFAATSLWRVGGVLVSRFTRLSAKNMQHLSELAAASLMAQMASVIWRPVGTLVTMPVEVRLCVVCLAITGWIASGRNVLFGLMLGIGGVLIGAG
jgi:uncharacterized membrane protein